MYVCMYVCMYSVALRVADLFREIYTTHLSCANLTTSKLTAFQLRTASKQALARDIQLHGLRGFDIVSGCFHLSFA